MVLFDLNKYNIFQIDDENLSIINKLSNLNNTDLNKLNSKELEIYDLLFKNEAKPIKSEIDTVKIHVSNSCNLQCKYCYAHGGNYGIENSLMSLETAKKVCDFIKDNITNLKYITFFGGEPLLAVEQIIFICNEFKNMGIKFLLQTNGTILNDQIIQLLNDFNITVTVSLDGPEDINDINRVDKTNNGTYKTIINNMDILNKKTNKGVTAVQATYTNNAKNKYSRSSVIKHLKKVSNAKFIKLENVCSDENTLKISESNTLAEDHLNKILKFLNEDKLLVNDDITNFLKYFFSRRSYNDNFCEAGINILTIDCYGNLWPCQLFLNNTDYYMGNIQDSLFNPDFKKVFKNLTHFKKSLDIECKKCISRCFCSRCLGLSSILQNQSINDYKKFGNKCCLSRELTIKTLDLLSKYVSENKFEDFNSNIVKIFECKI